MHFHLTYGSQKVSFTISDRALAQDQPFIEPRKVTITAEMADIEGAIKKALGKPVDSPKLRELAKGRTVAMVVSDEFRAGCQEMIIKCLIEEIVKGGPLSLTILCATGSHEPAVYAKNIKAWAEKYAKEFKQNITFIANNCDNKDFINIGNCSDGTPIELHPALLKAELRVYGHESKHHYMNGYSCVDKQVLPGMASRRTIEGNHKNALQDEFAVAGRNVWVKDKSRQKNPFSQGSFEARRRSEEVMVDEKGNVIECSCPIHGANVQPDKSGNYGLSNTISRPAVFALDMISDKKAIYWVKAGDASKVSTEMTLEADRLAAFKVEPVKYVVISPGGAPASQAIYGVQNCFDMALSGAICEGGEALVIAPCDGRPDLPKDVSGLAPDRKAKELFWDNLCRLKDKPLKEATDWIRDNFELYLWKTDRVLKLMNGRKVKLYLHSTLPDEVIKAGGFLPCRDVSAWIKEREARVDGAFRVIEDGNKILVMTAKN